MDNFSVFILITIRVPLHLSFSVCLPMTHNTLQLDMDRSKYHEIKINLSFTGWGREGAYFVSSTIPAVISLEQNIKYYWKFVNFCLGL